MPREEIPILVSFCNMKEHYCVVSGWWRVVGCGDTWRGGAVCGVTKSHSGPIRWVRCTATGVCVGGREGRIINALSADNSTAADNSTVQVAARLQR